MVNFNWIYKWFSMAQLVNFRRSMVVHRYQPFGANEPNWCFLGESRDIHLSPFIIWVHQNHLWNAIYIYIYIDTKWYQDVSMKYAFDELIHSNFPTFFLKPRFAMDFSWTRTPRFGQSTWPGDGQLQVKPREFDPAGTHLDGSVQEYFGPTKGPEKRWGKFRWNYGDLDLWDGPITMGGFHACRLL